MVKQREDTRGRYVSAKPEIEGQESRGSKTKILMTKICRAAAGFALYFCLQWPSEHCSQEEREVTEHGAGGETGRIATKTTKSREKNEPQIHRWLLVSFGASCGKPVSRPRGFLAYRSCSVCQGFQLGLLYHQWASVSCW